ncbi:MAG TPA: hypothetical protein VN903_19080 [Polyangia bacterium]|jgi:Tfp pilus assembly protein PilF|nr:hypothetical protein [Polyangia bacterium]
MIASRICVAVSLALLALGCSKADVRSDNRWVAEAERRHALADERLQASDPTGAKEALLGIVDGPVVADVAPDDRRGVLQDTYFRLAEIELRARDAHAALASADRGLALGRRNDLFVANLLVVRGAAHEALGEAPAAAEDYHQALVINDKLLAEALREGAAGAPTPGAQP